MKLPIPIIRNEELVLIYAEVQAQLGNPPNPKTAIDRVRNAASLGNYAGRNGFEKLLLQKY
jgi:hypothetical protein